ncbi:MAG: GWxTD domain-containing protein, partial [Balneolaceae bacterium]
MLLKTNIYRTTFSATLISLIAFTVSAQPNRAYDRGLNQLYSGNVTQALDLWYETYTDDPESSVDARIGIEFIRVVTEMGLRSYDEASTEMYFRALVAGEGAESRVAIRQEIERLKPIVGDGIFRQWSDWWDQRSEQLGSDMRGYWIRQDPTPADGVNERLIEHWERIATARKNFNKNSSTVYGTDDRALIFIRYGEPDRKYNGILTLQSLNIKPWLQRQLSPDSERGTQSRQSDHLSVPQDQEETVDRLQQAIYEFHRYPEYEIWFYENITTDQSEPIIFMFGTDVSNDSFKLQTSLEDFIPERAYHPNRVQAEESLEFTRAGITPALMLQLLYYEQLAKMDPFFENRLNRLRDDVLEQGIEAYRGMDQIFRNESKDLVNVRQLHIPRERSSYEEIIPKIPLNVYQYRFLDDELKPMIITYIESSPEEAFLIDYHRNSGRINGNGDLPNDINILEEFSFYELKHTLQMYNHKWALTEQYEDLPPLYISRGQTNEKSNTFFISPHSSRAQMAASIQLHNYDPDSRTIDDTPFSPSIRGWNKLQYRQPKPLKSHPDSLEVADLVLGYPDSTGVTKPFSFRVANNQIIPFGETLLLHFEVYNLKRMNNTFTQFELTYRILPVDDDGRILSDQSEFILTLNFINEEEQVVEDLEIETADLSPGLYELVVVIIDTESEQRRERYIRFEVV